jgi:hypothetical protein
MSSSCVQDAAAVGRERRGDRIVVALRRAPFCAGYDFLAATFSLAAQICTVYAVLPDDFHFRERRPKFAHHDLLELAACQPKALRDTALMTDDATIKLNAKA